MQKYNLVIFWYQNDWGYYYRRNEALTRQFSTYTEIQKVIHIEPPSSLITVGKLLFKYFFRKDKSLQKIDLLHLKKLLSLGPIMINNKLYIFTPLVVFLDSIAQKWTFAKKMNEWLVKNQLNSILRSLDHSMETLILFYPPQQYTELIFLQAEHFKVKVFIDLVDDHLYNSKFSGVSDFKHEQIKSSYSISVQKASKIFSVAKDMSEKYSKRFNRKIIYIPNGVDEHQSKNIAINNIPREQSYPKKIVFVGNIGYPLDLNIAKKIFNDFKENKFIFVGPISKKVRKNWSKFQKQFSNVLLLGPMIHCDAVKFMENADVLIHFNDPSQVAGFDSMKIYEYLITGKPIVTTPVSPSNKFADLVYIANNPKEFSRKLKQALLESDLALKRKRRDIARTHSWTIIAREIWKEMISS